MQVSIARTPEGIPSSERRLGITQHDSLIQAALRQVSFRVMKVAEGECNGHLHYGQSQKG